MVQLIPVPFPLVRKVQYLCRKILTENSIQMVSALFDIQNRNFRLEIEMVQLIPLESFQIRWISLDVFLFFPFQPEWLENSCTICQSHASPVRFRARWRKNPYHWERSIPNGFFRSNCKRALLTTVSQLFVDFPKLSSSQSQTHHLRLQFLVMWLLWLLRFTNMRFLHATNLACIANSKTFFTWWQTLSNMKFEIA